MKPNPLEYDYINNLVTGEKVAVEINDAISANEIVPLKLSLQLPFEISQKTADNRRSIVRSLGLIQGHRIYVVNSNTNETAYINRDTIKKSISNANRNIDYIDFLILVFNIEYLYKTSQKILSYKDAKENTQTIIKRYANMADINNRIYLIEFTLKSNGEVHLYALNALNNLYNNVVPNKHLSPEGSALDTTYYTFSIPEITNVFKTKLIEKYNFDYRHALKFKK